MAAEVRDWQEDDLPWFLALHRRLDPEADLVALAALVAGEPGAGERRLVAVDDDQRAGVAFLRHGTGLPVLYLLVDPVHRHRGHGRALFDAIEGENPGLAMGADRATDERSLDIAHRWGFVEVVPEADGGPWLVRSAT